MVSVSVKNSNYLTTHLYQCRIVTYYLQQHSSPGFDFSYYGRMKKRGAVLDSDSSDPV